MTTQILDNYLPQEYFNSLKNKILNPAFTWNFIGALNQFQTNNEDTYFVHYIYEEHEPRSFLWDDLKGLMNNLQVKVLFRAKVNFYLKTKNLVEHARHIDYDISHKGAILYLNTCDGFTRLHDGTTVESIENRLLLFDSSQLHNSTTTTDDVGRYNININYL